MKKNGTDKLECCRCQRLADVEQGRLDFNLDGVWVFTCSECCKKELQRDKKNQEIRVDCKAIPQHGR